MKKIIFQILLILLIITIGITSVFITKVNAASIAGLNVSSATEGGTFTVSLILPENAFGANCNIEVIYSDGSKTTVGTGGETGIAYVKGMEAMGFANSITFSAKIAGATQIKATSIVIVDESNNFLENGGNKEQTITIEAKAPETTTTPTLPPVTTPTPAPSEPSSSENNGSINNNVNTNTNTNTTVDNTTKKPEVVNPTFKEVKETVYATNGCNVRSSCSTEISSNKIGGLVKGQSVTRTGVEDTWSRIEFNGKTAYVATRLLTTEEPVKEEPENTVKDNTIKNTVTNNIVKDNTVKDNTVEVNTVENIIVENNVVSNEQILNQIEQEIGVLPEVGQNIATIMFAVISIFSLIMIMRLQYKSKD